MKKTLALLLALVMVLAMAACGSSTTTSTPAADTNNQPADTAPANSGSESTTPADSTDVADAPTYELTAADYAGPSFIDPLTEWSRYDALIAEIKAETDFAKRTELMHQAEDILMATSCVIPIYYYNDIYMQKDYVDGIYSNPFATKFFMYSSLNNGSDTLRLQLASEPDYLDPALNSSVDGACLAANSFSGLYTYNAEGKTVPACATGYELSEDGKTYTVTLRDGLKWSDGSDLTAADFEYAWKRAAADETAADYAYMFNGFDGFPNELNVTALDATTLQFVLTAPCAYMEDLMAFPTFYPVKQSAVESYANWQTSPGGWCTEAGFVSNGAYTCTGWNHSVSMTYEKNPYWYDADKVTVEKLEYMLSADDTAIFAAYNAGDLDFCDTVPTDEIANLLANNNSEFHIVDELGTYYVAFNCKSDIFEGKDALQAACMRRAFSVLIDRDYICDNIGQTGQVAANSFIPAGMADGNGGVFKSDETSFYYDPYYINNDYEGAINSARHMLELAGYEFDDNGMLSASNPIQLTYLTNPTSGHIAIAESIQQDLAAVGIDLSIEQQDWNVFLEERKAGNFDFAREGWIADFNDPINMLEMWTTASGNNDCQFGR
ncbi:MAG: peptide ABC transporter substrate-binding protein [Oscillospiraceae bacterium]|nr:peptide ABC transporter substrate-binding protein [Oscillospiraceae bacterium]